MRTMRTTDYMAMGLATCAMRASDLNYENEQLRQQLETERIRLAACGVIALANTPESAAEAREMKPEYWSASARDVADVVDREMELRQQLAQCQKERDHYKKSLSKYGHHIDGCGHGWSCSCGFYAAIKEGE